jgi:hypothetical protein
MASYQVTKTKTNGRRKNRDRQTSTMKTQIGKHNQIITQTEKTYVDHNKDKHKQALTQTHYHN